MDNNTTYKAAANQRGYSNPGGTPEGASLSNSLEMPFDAYMFGVITKAVAIPAITGALLGIWLDNLLSNQFTWTLRLLVAGLVVGYFNAKQGVSREEAMTREERGDYEY